MFFLLSRRGRLGWKTSSLGGFLAGFVPGAVIMSPFPGRYPGYSSGRNWYGVYVRLFEDGDPTVFAWLVHLHDSLIWGVYGALAAAVFWKTWNWLSQDDPPLSRQDVA